MIIETERIILREMTRDDFDVLYRLLGDSDIMRHYPYTFDEKRVMNWINRNIERYGIFGFGLWALVLKETGEMAGDCGLTMQNAGEFGEVVEVGYIFRRDFWHRGYASEAAIACRDHAFEKLGVPEVFSIIRVGNVSSENVARCNGMSPCGALTKHYYGMDMPHTIYSVRAEELSRGQGTP